MCCVGCVLCVFVGVVGALLCVVRVCVRLMFVLRFVFALLGLLVDVSAVGVMWCAFCYMLASDVRLWLVMYVWL